MRRFVVLGIAAMVATACGVSGSGNGSVTAGAKGASDVQATGMGKTYAGQMRCNPKNAERPFVIEWDATDMSSFESRARPATWCSSGTRGAISR